MHHDDLVQAAHLIHHKCMLLLRKTSVICHTYPAIQYLWHISSTSSLVCICSCTNSQQMHQRWVSLYFLYHCLIVCLFLAAPSVSGASSRYSSTHRWWLEESMLAAKYKIKKPSWHKLLFKASNWVTCIRLSKMHSIPCKRLHIVFEF